MMARNGLVEVRVRNEVEPHARAVLGSVPLTRDALDDVLRLVDHWEIYDGVGRSGAECDRTGQFVYDGSETYFEIVLHDGLHDG